MGLQADGDVIDMESSDGVSSISDEGGNRMPLGGIGLPSASNIELTPPTSSPASSRNFDFLTAQSGSAMQWQSGDERNLMSSSEYKLRFTDWRLGLATSTTYRLRLIA